MNQAGLLYQLQQMDSQRDGILKRLKEVEQRLSENAAIRTAQSQLELTKESAATWQKRLKELELERTQLKTESDTTEERLYSGRVSNPRELTDLQNKLAELKQRHESLEDPLLEAMEGVEASGQAVIEADTELAQVKAAEADRMGELLSEQGELEPQLQALNDDIEQARQKIDAGSLQTYDLLRTPPSKLAVTALSGDACGACGVELTTRDVQLVRRGRVVQCPTCQRILATS